MKAWPSLTLILLAATACDDSASGTCSVANDDDGRAVITCADGSSATISPGSMGTAGDTGPAGAAGPRGPGITEAVLTLVDPTATATAMLEAIANDPEGDQRYSSRSRR